MLMVNITCNTSLLFMISTLQRAKIWTENYFVYETSTNISYNNVYCIVIPIRIDTKIVFSFRKIEMGLKCGFKIASNDFF